MPTPQSVSRQLAGSFQRNSFTRPYSRRGAKVATGGFEVMKSQRYLGAVVVMFHLPPTAVMRLSLTDRLGRRLEFLHGYRARLEPRWNATIMGLDSGQPYLLVTDKREEASK